MERDFDRLESFLSHVLEALKAELMGARVPCGLTLTQINLARITQCPEHQGACWNETRAIWRVEWYIVDILYITISLTNGS